MSKHKAKSRWKPKLISIVGGLFAALALVIGAVSGFGAAPAYAGQPSSGPQVTDVTWQLPPGQAPLKACQTGTWTTIPGCVTQAAYPQKLVTNLNAVPCGIFLQTDAELTNQVARLTADGVLTYGEDFGIAQQWKFTYTGDCATQIPVPVVQAPGAPTCDNNGTLPPLPSSSDWTARWDRPFNGPGSYNAIFTMNNGANKVFPNGSKTAQVTVSVLPKQTGATCPPPPPVVKPCVNSGSLVWTKNANVTSATVTLKQGFTTCDVSLNSYKTEGATWETSGNQTLVDHETAHLSAASPTATLNVLLQGCYDQTDLYTGTTRFDGTDGALPHYPNNNVPTGLLDHWNGKNEPGCIPPQPQPTKRIVHHSEQSCTIGGVNAWDTVFTTTPVWDTKSQQWVGVEDKGVDTAKVFTPYTTDEMIQKGCAVIPNPPTGGCKVTVPTNTDSVVYTQAQNSAGDTVVTATGVNGVKLLTGDLKLVDSISWTEPKGGGYCPPSTPPATPPASTVTTHQQPPAPKQVAVQASSLATTGSYINPAVIWSAIGLIALGIGAVASQPLTRRRKATQQQ